MRSQEVGSQEVGSQRVKMQHETNNIFTYMHFFTKSSPETVEKMLLLVLEHV